MGGAFLVVSWEFSFVGFGGVGGRCPVLFWLFVWLGFLVGFFCCCVGFVWVFLNCGKCQCFLLKFESKETTFKEK